MICWFDARETYSDKTKDFAWYFQPRLWFVDLVHEKLLFWQKKRLIARYFQYRLYRSVHEKLILTLTKNFAWYFQYRMWFVDLVHETYSDRTKNFVDTFNIDCDLLIWCARNFWYFRILSDLLILCRRNLFWQNKGIRLIVLTYIMICSCMNNLFTEQRASLDTFQYIAICCERNLFWQNKDFAWYLSICCDLLYGKHMYLTRW